MTFCVKIENEETDLEFREKGGREASLSGEGEEPGNDLAGELSPSSPPVSQAGDVLNLLERISGDWYSGENTRTGDFGDFPASSVRVIEPLP